MASYIFAHCIHFGKQQSKQACGCCSSVDLFIEYFPFLPLAMFYLLLPCLITEAFLRCSMMLIQPALILFPILNNCTIWIFFYDIKFCFLAKWIVYVTVYFVHISVLRIKRIQDTVMCVYLSSLFFLFHGYSSLNCKTFEVFLIESFEIPQQCTGYHLVITQVKDTEIYYTTPAYFGASSTPSVPF